MLLQRVEVIVSDNCSSDETPNVVKSAAEGGLPIRYTKTDAHISGNENIAHCVSLSERDYVWCVGDDDLLAPGCLAIVLKWIESGKSFVILNYVRYLREKPKELIGPWFRLKQDIVFHDAADVLKTLSAFPTFISAVIADKRILDFSGRSEEYETYGWNQLYSFYRGVVEQPRGILVVKPYLVACANSDTHYDWERYFIEGLARVFGDLASEFRCYSGLDRSAKEKVFSWYIVKYIYGRRLQGYDVTNAIYMTRQYYSDCKQIWIIQMIGVIPCVCLRFLDRIKLAVRQVLSIIGKLTMSNVHRKSDCESKISNSVM